MVLMWGRRAQRLTAAGERRLRIADAVAILAARGSWHKRQAADAPPGYAHRPVRRGPRGRRARAGARRRLVLGIERETGTSIGFCRIRRPEPGGRLGGRRRRRRRTERARGRAADHALEARPRALSGRRLRGGHAGGVRAATTTRSTARLAKPDGADARQPRLAQPHRRLRRLLGQAAPKTTSRTTTRSRPAGGRSSA